MMQTGGRCWKEEERGIESEALQQPDRQREGGKRREGIELEGRQPGGGTSGWWGGLAGNFERDKMLRGRGGTW